MPGRPDGRTDGQPQRSSQPPRLAAERRARHRTHIGQPIHWTDGHFDRAELLRNNGALTQILSARVQLVRARYATGGVCEAV